MYRRYLPLCPENTSYCRKRKQSRTPYCDHRKSGSSGGDRNQRMVLWPLHCDQFKEEARAFLSEEHEKICIVSQTTFNYNNFQEIVEILNEKRYDRLVLNTICNATQDRQREAEEIAKQVDAMIVVGGRHSSNTQKLYEYVKRNVEILTIYRHLLIWILNVFVPFNV